MVTSDILLVPVAAGLLTAVLLPFTGYRWDGRFVRPVAATTIGLAASQFGLGFFIDDISEIGPGSARWIGNMGAVAILLVNAASLIITTRALKRKSRGLPYRF